MKSDLYLIVVASIIFISGCVSTSKYEEALAETEATRQSLESARMKISLNQQQLEETNRELADTDTMLIAAREELANLDKMKRELQRELVDSRSSLDQSQADLDASQNALVESRTALVESRTALDESRQQMLTLKNIEEETKRRNQIYEQFVSRLQRMIDGGQLTVSIEQGRIVINLPDNILFTSGSADLNPEGKDALSQIAAVLSQFTDRRFQIEGHTDNKPIKSSRFPSNWELSTSRALTVLHLMIELGVAGENISAAGFGEFRPRADNETDEGRKLNRRIEIVMLPNLDILSSELPKVMP